MIVLDMCGFVSQKYACGNELKIFFKLLICFFCEANIFCENTLCWIIIGNISF